MLKIIYRGDDQLRIIENGKQEILAKRASKYYYLSKQGDYIVYLSNSQNWHSGDLFIKHEGKKAIQLGCNVHLIYVSPTADIVIFINDYFNSDSGSLYIVRDGKKRVCLDRNVISPVMMIEKANDRFKVLYGKKNTNLAHTLCVIDENGNKHALGKKFNNVRFFATNQDQIRTVGEVKRYVGNVEKVQTFSFLDELLSKTQFTKQYINDPLDKVVFNEQTHRFQEKHFQQIGFEGKSDEIVFRFANHTSNRYFVACEVAKRAKRHVILESLYEQDDSINHYVSFSPDQIDDILLLHYTLTTGTHFLFKHKLFGFDVEDIAKNTGAVYGMNGVDYANIVNSHFMVRDTSEKVTFRNIQERLMYIHGFSYRRELKAYLYRTFVDPLQDQYSKTMYFYNKFIRSRQEEDTLLDRMKQLEEEMILDRRIPSKWKSEAEMFRIIKEEYPTARMHVSPDWLSPQHLDVYVEDLNIAFEYQGLQHFSPIEFFGGEEGLNKRIKLDQRKKELCLNFGINLVEWMFHEPVTKLVLKQKMKVEKNNTDKPKHKRP